MNKDLLKIKANELEALLLNYSNKEADAAALLKILHPLIKHSKNMKVESHLEWSDIPGSRFFSEGRLADLTDLEKAFAEFRIQLTGGEPLALQKLRKKHKN